VVIRVEGSGINAKGGYYAIPCYLPASRCYSGFASILSGVAPTATGGDTGDNYRLLYQKPVKSYY